MRVWHGLDEVDADFGPSVVTIGNFDGVHRGHQAMLALLNNEARHCGVPVARIGPKSCNFLSQPPSVPALGASLGS